MTGTYSVRDNAPIKIEKEKRGVEARKGLVVVKEIYMFETHSKLVAK